MWFNGCRILEEFGENHNKYRENVIMTKQAINKAAKFCIFLAAFFSIGIIVLAFFVLPDSVLIKYIIIGFWPICFAMLDKLFFMIKIKSMTHSEEVLIEKEEKLEKLKRLQEIETEKEEKCSGHLTLTTMKEALKNFRTGSEKLISLREFLNEAWDNLEKLINFYELNPELKCDKYNNLFSNYIPEILLVLSTNPEHEDASKLIKSMSNYILREVESVSLVTNMDDSATINGFIKFFDQNKSDFIK